jgi:hypothetical protein
MAEAGMSNMAIRVSRDETILLLVFCILLLRASGKGQGIR